MKEETSSPSNFNIENIKSKVQPSESLGNVENASELELINARLTLIEEIIKERKALENQTNPLLQKIDQLQKTNPEKAKKWRSIITRVLRSANKLVFASSLVFFSIAATQHHTTRWKVEIKTDPITNEQIFEHEDPETTHIINILSGKEKLTKDEQIKLLKELLASEYFLPFIQENGIFTGKEEDIMNASEGEIIQILRTLEMNKSNNSDDKTSQNNEITDDELLKDYAQVGDDIYDPEVYKTLWKLTQDGGNPKIRLQFNTKVWDKSRDASYDYANNVIYIRPSANNEIAIERFIAEISHGKQFSEKPYSARGQALIDILIKVPKNMILDQEGPISAYNQLYDKEGTMEHEAHSKIEPTIKKEYEENTKNGPWAEREQEEKERIKELAKEWKDKRNEIFKRKSNEIYQLLKQKEKEWISVPESSKNALDMYKEVERKYDLLLNQIETTYKMTLYEYDKTKPNYVTDNLL